MKKIVILLICILLMCFCLPLLAACDNDGATSIGSGDRLVIYNWEDYIDSSILNDFADYYEEVTGRALSITYTTYDTNETMMTKVLKNDANVDLICPSEYSIEKLLTSNCLLNQKELLAEIQPTLDELEISLDNMSSLGNGWGNIEDEVMDVIKDMFGEITAKDGKTYDMTEFMVPYMWGTLGILYNTSVVSLEELEEYGWGVLWNVQNNEKLENKILMKDSVRDSYAAAVFYMKQYDLLPDGYDDYTVGELLNCTDDIILEYAERVLTEQREHISGYEVDFGKDDMINEIVYADFAWSGDALWAIEEGGYDEETDTYQLGYYIPYGDDKTWSNIWYDGWCIPKSVNNKLAAMMFIDYMCRPTSGIRNSMQIGYTCAIDKEIMQDDEEVCEFIEDNDYDIDEYFDNEGRYPSIDNTLGVMRDFGAKNETVVQMWQRAKSGAAVSPALGWILLAMALAAGIAIGTYFIATVLRYRPRKLKNKDAQKETPAQNQ